MIKSNDEKYTITKIRVVSGGNKALGKLIGTLTGAAAGVWSGLKVGASIGIASGGTAIAGTIPCARVGGIIGALSGFIAGDKTLDK